MYPSSFSLVLAATVHLSPSISHLQQILEILKAENKATWTPEMLVYYFPGKCNMSQSNNDPSSVRHLGLASASLQALQHRGCISVVVKINNDQIMQAG